LPPALKVGVISDTHGYVDPRLADLLAGVELILHAGDICGSHVIAALEQIAPVVAVSGNNDVKADTRAYPGQRVLELAGQRLLLLHQYKPPPRPDHPGLARCQEARLNAVVFGHSHRAVNTSLGGVLFFNPGAACKPRFRDIPSIGLLHLEPAGIRGEIVLLQARLHWYNRG